jgi:hypothetical protein
MSEIEFEMYPGEAASNPYFLDGFGVAEGGHRWSIGRTSQMRIPVRRIGKMHLLVLEVIPWLSPPDIAAQRIIVGLNGRYATTIAVTHDMAIGLSLPGNITQTGEVVVSLDHIDSPASRTIDTYRDGSSMGLMLVSVRLFYTRPRLGVPVVELPPVKLIENERSSVVKDFQSLGHRCAFALLQRRWHADHLSLLQFSGMLTPILVRELVRGFAGLGNPSDLHAFIREDHRGLYSLYDRGRQIWFNTSEKICEVSEAEVVARAARRLAFLKRKLLEDLALADKIFILSSPYEVVEAEALAVHTALNLYGPNRLVWTNQQGDLPPGTVRRVAAGLFFGQLDYSGLTDRDPSDEAWFSVCKNVLSLLQN